MQERITLHITSKDRHSELALLLQSLRTQTIQNFDILILDDASGSPVHQCNFISLLMTRMKLEGHKFKMVRNEISHGCCYARNKLIEEDDFDNTICMRCDDDVILESDYIEKLMEGIEAGYDMMTGVVPLIGSPELIRETKNLNRIMNTHEFDKDGNLIRNDDECGYCYDEDKIIQTHQFRTNCLYKSEINKKVKYPTNLSTVAFREEGFFSFGAIIEGYKIGVNTGAVCYHFQTPSGGNRRQDYNECVQLDEQTWRKWLKMKFDKHGDFLK
jgi:GT2 family glycosyltransferase